MAALTNICLVTDNLLCKAYMEKDETAADVLLVYSRVAYTEAHYLGNPGSLRDIVSSAKALLGFLEKLAWSE